MVSVGDLAPRTKREQYFFDEASIETLSDLLVPGNVACLCTPTLHEHLLEKGIASTVFDIDSRVVELFSDSAYAFDLNKPAGRQISTELLGNYTNVIIDPPFDTVDLGVVAERVRELLNFENGSSRVVLVHQGSRRPLLEKLFRDGLGLVYREDLTKQIKHIPNGRKISAPICAYVFDKLENLYMIN